HTAGNTSQLGRDQDMRPTSAWRREWGSDEHVPTANSSAGRPDREANRAAGGWQERNADDYFLDHAFSGARCEPRYRSAGNWRRERVGEDRWQDREAERTWSSRRDRYGDYPRNDDRRLRAARDDDFVTGRAERIEGPLTIF